MATKEVTIEATSLAQAKKEAAAFNRTSATWKVVLSSGKRKYKQQFKIVKGGRITKGYIYQFTAKM